MKGWSYSMSGKPRDALKLFSTLPDAQASSRQTIVINVHAVALNPDSGVLMRILPSLLTRKSRIPEIDFSGVISEESRLPSDCAFRTGYAVYGHIPPIKHVTGNIGVLSGKVAISPTWIISKPADLGYEEAASLPTSFVSAHKLAKGVRNGARVFVNGGSGGVGLVLLQLLKNWKQADVTTTASDQSWHVVERQHPDAILNYREIDNLSEHLRKSYPRFDYVIDLVGDMHLLRNSRKTLLSDGTFIAFGGGLASSSILHFLSWLVRTVTIGVIPRWLGGCGSRFRFVAVHKEKDTVEGLNVLEDFWRRDLVKPCIDSIYAFEDALEAYDRLARYGVPQECMRCLADCLEMGYSSRRADGKVVIRINQEQLSIPSSPT